MFGKAVCYGRIESFIYWIMSDVGSAHPLLTRSEQGRRRKCFSLPAWGEVRDKKVYIFSVVGGAECRISRS